TQKEDGAYDVGRATYWDSPQGGRGKLWEAALTLRDLSLATAQNAGGLAQSAAGRFGRTNGADTAFIVPMSPHLPYYSGTFESFAPVLTGRFRVRLVEPLEATLEMPIYEEVDRINKLDLSLDDVNAMLKEIQRNLDDITSISSMLLKGRDWALISSKMNDIAGRVDNIETLRNDIGNRLDEMQRLGGMGRRITEIREKIAEIREELTGGKDLQKLIPWVEELREIHQNPEESDGLDEMVFQEGDLELTEKEDRLANLHGTCPGGGIPDYKKSPLYRLGPYATLHRWRWDSHEYSTVTGPGWVGDPEIGAGSERRGGRLMGYLTYGPYRWTLDQATRSFGLVGSRYTGALDVSRFAYYVRLGANIKLAYVYGVKRPQNIRYVTRWITDYEQARQFAQDPQKRRRIIRTRYYRPLVLSSVKWDHPNWLKDQRTYWSGNPNPYPFDEAAQWVWEPRGWYDVPVRRPGARKLNDYVWRWNREYPA
ncbi:MAG: hypothetical protein KAJ01_08915, partial [Candidatus Hydrogenedentes bacterium]|nr:hypothetical protein [Candidatus Hydrogenedentota bacterium]